MTEDHSSGARGRVQQALGLRRTGLQQQDLSVPGREVVQSRVDIGPEAPLVKRLNSPPMSSKGKPLLTLAE